MKSISNLIIEMYNEVMYQIENNLFEERLNSKESFRRAIALWKNLPEGKKESEAKRILKASKREGYIVKQKEILAYADSIVDYKKIKAKKAVRKEIRSKKKAKREEKFEKIKSTVEDKDLENKVNIELKAIAIKRGIKDKNLMRMNREELINLLIDNKEKLTTKEKEKVENYFEDFGEKIGMAKKDMYGKYLEHLDSNTEVAKFINLPKVKVLPEPDYQKLKEQGVSDEKLIQMKFLFDELGDKPRKKWQLNTWANKALRTNNDLKKILNSEDDGSFKNSSEYRLHFPIYSEILNKLGFPKEEVKDRITFSYSRGKLYRYYYDKDGRRKVDERGVPIYQPGYDGKGDYKTIIGATINGTVKTNDYEDNSEKLIDSVVDHIKKKREESNKEEVKTEKPFDVLLYQSRLNRKYYAGKKVGKEVIKLSSDFDDLKTLREYVKVKENTDKMKKIYAEELLKFKESNKGTEKGAERIEDERERQGKNWRQGSNITAKEFDETFGLRGVEFGNWVNQSERQHFVNKTYDSFMDLADVLGIDSKDVSLNGDLAFAFGARGSGGKKAANAHYEPGKRVINLTKMRGKGTVAHEWFHALDNFLGKNKLEDSNVFSVSNFSTESYKNYKFRGSNDEFIQATKQLMDTIKNSDYSKRSTKNDRGGSTTYWGSPIEMSARAFESYIVNKLDDKKLQNDFLSRFRTINEWEKVNFDKDKYPYPTKEEIKQFEPLFDKYIEEAKIVLKK